MDLVLVPTTWVVHGKATQIPGQETPVAILGPETSMELQNQEAL